MKEIDNVNITLCDELKKQIKENSKVSVAAAFFSIYAFSELKEQLANVKEFRFLFSSPAFVFDKEREKVEKKEFFIPRISYENCLSGSEFEVRLRNELSQKTIAKECAEWIKKKASFKANVTESHFHGFIVSDQTAFYPIEDFSSVQLGKEKGNNAFFSIFENQGSSASRYLAIFNSFWNSKEKLKDVKDKVLESLSTVYQENSPEFIYYFTLYKIFNEFLEDVSEDTLPNEATGFKSSVIWNALYDFQKDAALAIINKLEKYNGCVLADSVGLGKTYTALAVIKYYENRNKTVLVLCPKKLSSNWTDYTSNYVNNPLLKDRFNYDVLYHTDLSRSSGRSNGIDLSRINWGNYDLVVIDESHNFRNGGKLDAETDGKVNRYQVLMNKVMRAGVKSKVLMLSATPVNNRFTDLRNQLQLAYEGDSSEINDKLNTSKPIEEVFRSAQAAYTKWSKLPWAERTTQGLLDKLDFDFFEVLDSVTIARSRKHIEKYYDCNRIGSFPERRKPVSLSPGLSDLKNAINYNEIFDQLMALDLTIYIPSCYILPSKRSKYSEIYDANMVNEGFSQINREQGIRRLMAINLMKRLESSVYSFNLTLKRIRNQIDSTLNTIDSYDNRSHKPLDLVEMTDLSQCDEDDQESSDLFSIGKKVRIDIADMDYLSWRKSLRKDLDTLNLLVDMVEDINPQHDCKLQVLFETLCKKIRNPINEGNSKVLIFTAFADTAEYLFENVSGKIKESFGLDSAMVTGSSSSRTTIPRFSTDFNSILSCFSPVSKDRASVPNLSGKEIDILIATDCISEGQNLQDCDCVINYDIHWNPVRIIQRFGRIDRIGSKNKEIQLINFWPDISLDEYINLKGRVETRMKIVDIASTGNDDILDDEKIDLEYRKEQLKKLKEEVVDIEDMTSGISIMDLGLNEFRLDLLEYVKQNKEIFKAPNGIYAVVGNNKDFPSGVIFVLRNRNNSVDINKQNRLHPFYMVYVQSDGKVYFNHLQPKQLLDAFRFLCRGKPEPIREIIKEVDRETSNGKNMKAYSKLLNAAIGSILQIKQEGDVDAFLEGFDVDFRKKSINGIDDFELVDFLIVR